MSKRTIGILSILSFLLALVSAGLIVTGIVGIAWLSTAGGNTTSSHSTGIANLPLFIVGVIIASLALVVHLTARAGALVTLARLQHWGWFVLVLVFQGIAVLLYLIAGPTTHASVSHAAQPEKS
jgi:hypothetical protein